MREPDTASRAAPPSDKSMISATINGKPYRFDAPVSIADYLRQRGLAGRSLAVAINGLVVPRNQHDQAVIEDGDRVEIVRPVGGG